MLTVSTNVKWKWNSLSCVLLFVTPYSPWNSPDQNTGVGSLSLLQGIFPTQVSNPGLPHFREILYQLSHKGSPRILEWVALSLLQWFFLTQESSQGLFHCRQILYQMSYQGSPNRKYKLKGKIFESHTFQIRNIQKDYARNSQNQQEEKKQSNINVQDFSFFLHWSIIAIQYCVNFYCIMKCISYMCAYISSLWPLTSHHLGHHRALSWVPCALQQVPTSSLAIIKKIYKQNHDNIVK